MINFHVNECNTYKNDIVREKSVISTWDTIIKPNYGDILPRG